MKISRAFVVLSSLLFACQAHAQPIEESLCAAPDVPPVDGGDQLAVARSISCVRAHFTQERRIAGLRNSVRGSGEILYVRGRGILWTLQSPDEMRIAILPSGIYEMKAAGNGELNLNLVSSASSRVSGLILSDDKEALEEKFDLLRSTGELRLVPKPGRMADAIEEISIAGAGLPSAVTVKDRKGTRTDYSLDSIIRAPFVLTKVERSILADGGE